MAELTRDDVMAMAKEAGFRVSSFNSIDPDEVVWGRLIVTDEIERLANLIAAKVRADEREECAKVCEGRIGGAVQSNEWWGGFLSAMKQCAEAIRARGNS